MNSSALPFWQRKCSATVCLLLRLREPVLILKQQKKNQTNNKKISNQKNHTEKPPLHPLKRNTLSDDLMEYKNRLEGTFKGHLTYSDLYSVINICQISDSHEYTVRKMFYYFLLTVVQNTR